MIQVVTVSGSPVYVEIAEQVTVCEVVNEDFNISLADEQISVSIAGNESISVIFLAEQGPEGPPGTGGGGTGNSYFPGGW